MIDVIHRRRRTDADRRHLDPKSAKLRCKVDHHIAFMPSNGLDLFDRFHVVRMPGVSKNSSKIDVFCIRDLPRNIYRFGRMRLDADPMRAAVDLHKNIESDSGLSRRVV